MILTPEQKEILEGKQGKTAHRLKPHTGPCTAQSNNGPEKWQVASTQTGSAGTTADSTPSAAWGGQAAASTAAAPAAAVRRR